MTQVKSIPKVVRGQSVIVRGLNTFSVAPSSFGTTVFRRKQVTMALSQKQHLVRLYKSVVEISETNCVDAIEIDARSNIGVPLCAVISHCSFIVDGCRYLACWCINHPLGLVNEIDSRYFTLLHHKLKEKSPKQMS